MAIGVHVKAFNHSTKHLKNGFSLKVETIFFNLKIFKNLYIDFIIFIPDWLACLNKNCL